MARSDPAAPGEREREALLRRIEDEAVSSKGFLLMAEARRLLADHDAKVRAEAVEECLARVHFEEDATKAAIENATGVWLTECLVAKKVLRHVAEKIAALRARAPKHEGKP